MEEELIGSIESFLMEEVTIEKDIQGKKVMVKEKAIAPEAFTKLSEALGKCGCMLLVEKKVIKALVDKRLVPGNEVGKVLTILKTFGR